MLNLIYCSYIYYINNKKSWHNELYTALAGNRYLPAAEIWIHPLSVDGLGGVETEVHLLRFPWQPHCFEVCRLIQKLTTADVCASTLICQSDSDVAMWTNSDLSFFHETTSYKYYIAYYLLVNLFSTSLVFGPKYPETGVIPYLI